MRSQGRISRIRYLLLQGCTTVHEVQEDRTKEIASLLNIYIYVQSLGEEPQRGVSNKAYGTWGTTKKKERIGVRGESIGDREMTGVRPHIMCSDGVRAQRENETNQGVEALILVQQRGYARIQWSREKGRR